MSDTARCAPAPAWRRWAWRLLVAAVVMALAALLAVLAVLPRLAERVIARALQRRGLEGVAVAVQGLSWDRAVLGPIHLRDDAGAARVDAVVLRFSPRRLWRGQLDEVVVSGLHLVLRQRAAGWAVDGLEALAPLRAPSDAPDGAGRPAGGPGAMAPALRLRSSQVEVVAGPGSLRIPIEASLALPASGEALAQGRLWVAGTTLDWTAAVDPATGSGRARANVAPGALTAWLLEAAKVGIEIPSGVTDPWRLGKASAEVSLRLQAWSPAQIEGQVLLEPLEARHGALAVRLYDLRLGLRAGAGLADLAVTLSGMAQPTGLPQVTTEPLPFQGSWDGTRAELSLSDLRGRAAGVALRGRAHVSARGLDDPATAALRGEIRLDEVVLPGTAALQGDLTLEGTPQDLRLDGALAPIGTAPEGALRLLVVDAALRTTPDVAARLLLSASLDPAALAAAVGAPGALTGEALTVELSTSLSRPASGAWQAQTRVEVAADALAAAVGATGVLTGEALTMELSTSLSRPPSGAWQAQTRVEVTANALAWAGADGLRLQGQAGFQAEVGVAPEGIEAAGAARLPGLAGEIAGVAFSADAVTAVLDHADWRGPVALSGRVLPAWPALRDGLLVRGHLHAAGVALRAPGAVSAEGIAMDLPWSWSRGGGLTPPPGSAAGSLRGGAFAVQSVRGEGFAGEVFLEGERLRLSGEVRAAAPAVTVAVEPILEWTHGLTLTARFSVPAFPVASADTWYHLPDLPADLRLAGRLSAEGTVLYDGRTLRLPCRLRLTEGSVDWPEQSLLVHGLAADLEWRDLAALQTAPFQEVTFASAKVHDIPIDGGRILAQLDGPQALILERCELNWCKGRVHTQALRIDPSAPELDLVLFADSVDMISALSLIKGFKGTGHGLLFGKLPLAYRNGRLSYSRGYLYSVPGQSGRLALESAGLLTAALPPNHPNWPELRRAEQALEDFRLDVFRLDFTGRQTGEPGARILLVGEGTAEKVPVRLNLNVNGPIEEAITMGLRLGGL